MKEKKTCCGLNRSSKRAERFKTVFNILVLGIKDYKNSIDESSLFGGSLVSTELGITCVFQKPTDA